MVSADDIDSYVVATEVILYQTSLRICDVTEIFTLPLILIFLLFVHDSKISHAFSL